MNIALFALAAVMIVGGIVSVIQGFPFVRLESGLAMTIAGASTASAGAVVLGLAVVARRLAGLAEAMRRVRHAEAAPAVVEPEPASALSSSRQRPSLAATAAGLGALGGAGLGAAALRTGREPSFFDPVPPPPAESPSANEPLLPNPLPEEAPSQRPEEEMLFGSPEPAAAPAPAPAPPHDVPPVEAPRYEPEPEPEPIALRPALAEAAPEPAFPDPVLPDPIPEPPVVVLPSEPEAAQAVQEPPQAESAPPQPEPERQVVGTYASGGNTYVMYSTGVIEAETPRGRYTFASLDELKAFVEAGGETDARGAA